MSVRRSAHITRHLSLPIGVLFATALLGAQVGTSRPGQAAPPSSSQRDRSGSASATEVKPITGAISGRVVAADSGRPVRMARVFLAGAQLQGGRGALTDNEGRFELTEVPEGRYTLTAGKTGFISLSYGQRRPLQPGIPIQLADGQQLTGLDFRLPRGSVISGHVYDDTGDPLVGAAVRVMRYEYAQGNRQLVPVGTAQTDDLGAYRVWGLNPGEYFVSATAPNSGGGRGGFFGGPPPPGAGPIANAIRGAVAGRGGRGGFGQPPAAAAAAEPEQVGYAPTFYPGVPSINEARGVTVALSAEVPSIDFGVLLVRTARVSGHVTNPDGTPTTAGNISLIPEAGGRANRGGLAGTFASRIDWDGSFLMAGVAPGRYILRARSDDTVQPQFAVQPITIAEGDLSNLTVVLSPAASVSGTVVFQATQGQQTPNPNSVRVAAPLVDAIDNGPNPTARVENSGTFTLQGLQAGVHLFRTQGSPRGWMLKSVLLNGRDIIDTPIELRSDQDLTGVTFVFSDKLTEVNGTITDDRNEPVTEYTLLAFPVDADLWRPQSRHIMTTRPDQTGKYQMRGLPAGEYYLVAVDPTENGEWFEPAYLDAHRGAATRVSLTEGDVKTQNFKVAGR